MKDLKSYINERIKDAYTYHPQDKMELIDAIEKEIKSQGNNADLNCIDTSEITNMCGLFYRSRFNGNISQWDTSNVTDMGSMFDGSRFNGDVSQWDVSKVKNMKFMFADCPLENNPPKWYKG